MPLTARGRPIHRATCRGMGSSHRWTWWSWQGTTCLTIPGATAPISSQPTGAYAPNMGPGGRRGGLLKGPTEDYMRGMAEPLMEIVVDNKPLRALVDTRATYPTVTRGTITDEDLSDKTVGVMGFSGGLEHWPMTKQLTVQVVNQSLPHSFLYSSNAPVPLLGRDLLIKLGASILCSPQGVIVTFPDGTTG